MKRKIIKLAEKTLVVSLPTSWVNTNQLEKGDELDVSITDSGLLIQPPFVQRQIKKVSVDIRNISERVLRWQISSLHKQGYDEIEILHYDEDQEKVLADLVEHLFVGFMVKERSSLRIVVGQVAVIDDKQFDTTLRQAFRQLEQTSKDIILAFEDNDATLLKKIIVAEQENNKLTNLCERLLNKSLEQKQKGHFWYVIAWNLEKVVDSYKYIAQYFLDALIAPKKDVFNIFKKLSDMVHAINVLFYEFSFEKLVVLSEQKKLLEKKVLHLLSQKDDFFTSTHERILVHYAHMIILQLTDFSASTIALRFEPKDRI